MDKLLKVLTTAVLVVWLAIGVFVLYSFTGGKDSFCQLFYKCCTSVQKERSLEDFDQGQLFNRLTPEVKKCVIGKLGKERVEEIVRQIRERKKPDAETLGQIQECMREIR